MEDRDPQKHLETLVRYMGSTPESRMYLLLYLCQAYSLEFNFLYHPLYGYTLTIAKTRLVSADGKTVVWYQSPDDAVRHALEILNDLFSQDISAE